MTSPQNYQEELAQRTGFKPVSELTDGQLESIRNYCFIWYSSNDGICIADYYWKESAVGDGNWISFDVTPHSRIAAPHLKEDE